MLVLLAGCTALPDEPAVLEEALLRFDLDHDGRVTEPEYATFAGTPSGFGDADADRDGRLTGEELGRWLRRTPPTGPLVPSAGPGIRR